MSCFPAEVFFPLLTMICSIFRMPLVCSSSSLEIKTSLSSSSPDLLQSDAATSSMHRDWNSKYVRLQLLLPHRQSDVHHLPPHLHADQDAPGYLSPGGPLSYRIQHIQHTGSYTPLNPPDRSSLFLAPPSSPPDFSPSRSRVTLPRYDDHWESLYSSRPTSMLPTPRHPSSTAAVSTRP